MHFTYPTILIDDAIKIASSGQFPVSQLDVLIQYPNNELKSEKQRVSIISSCSCEIKGIRLNMKAEVVTDETPGLRLSEHDLTIKKPEETTTKNSIVYLW